MDYPGNRGNPNDSPYAYPRRPEPARPHPGAPQPHPVPLDHGHYQPYPQQYPQPYIQPAKPSSGKAIGSLVTGLASLMFVPLGVISCPIGFALGIGAMRETSGEDAARSGRGMAIAGIWTNVGVFALSVLGLVGFIWLFSTLSDFEDDRHFDEYHYTQEYSSKADAREDARLIARRLETYYFRNGRSFGPGGPFLSYDEETPVRGALSIGHLVKDSELLTWHYEFDLVIVDEHNAKILHLPTGHEEQVNLQWR
jgi:hypothetical protein